MGGRASLRTAPKVTLTRAANVIAAVAVSVERLAATVERLAATLEQMAELQPHRADDLLAISRHARQLAARQRQRAQPYLSGTRWT
jgi:hypothetical protein